MTQQTRIEIQSAITKMINSFMVNNEIPAAIMEDALNKVMVQLKDKILDDLMAEAYQNSMNIQENEKAEIED